MSARRALTRVTLTGLLLLPASGEAGTRGIDLAKPYKGIELVGAHKVSGGGDVNGDGVRDVVVARGQFGQEPTNGRTYVVFGENRMEDLDLENLGDKGFVIEGSKPNDGASRATIVEDVNGDGLDDVVVGAPDADNNGRLVSGTAYVVFGKTSSSTVFLARFDALVQINEGFRIDGPHELALAGYQVGGLGDMNSDGLGDILVSAPFAGASYVVFGKTSMLPVDLRTFHNGTQGDAGFLIDTPAPGSDERYGAATVGDVNGDGIPDIAVALRMQREERKGAWIIFGKANSKAVDVIDLGKAGFRILADAGPLIEGIGDLNQDGLDDVLVGYPLSVVFGKRSSKTVALTDLSGKGYRIRIGKNSSAGQDASGVGDVNGDATPDFIIGAPAASKHGRPAAGSVYVVFGKANSRTITLWDLGGGGYRLDGVEPQDYLGSSVAGPGDINMDGIPDLIMGAPGSHDQRSGAYLLWGGK